jgi:hypothetical protein
MAEPVAEKSRITNLVVDQHSSKFFQVVTDQNLELSAEAYDSDKPLNIEAALLNFPPSVAEAVVAMLIKSAYSWAGGVRSAATSSTTALEIHCLIY